MNNWFRKIKFHSYITKFASSIILNHKFNVRSIVFYCWWTWTPYTYFVMQIHKLLCKCNTSDWWLLRVPYMFAIHSNMPVHTIKKIWYFVLWCYIRSLSLSLSLSLSNISMLANTYSYTLSYFWQYSSVLLQRGLEYADCITYRKVREHPLQSGVLSMTQNYIRSKALKSSGYNFSCIYFQINSDSEW